MRFSSSTLTAILVATTNACTELSQDIHGRALPAASWGYDSDDGPLSWYSLDPVANVACGKGRNQTPINLANTTARIEGSNAYTLKYSDLKNVPFISTHHTVQVDVASTNATNTLQFGGKTYDLLQFHFHVPSEHRIDDEYFPMEVHFVHRSAGMQPCNTTLRSPHINRQQQRNLQLLVT
jgi:carbonic anhydrase